MEAFKGKYTRTSAENYEEFLKEMNVSYLLRKAATISTPTLDVSEADGVWTIKTSTTLKSMELKFKVSERARTETNRELQPLLSSLVKSSRRQLLTAGR